MVCISQPFPAVIFAFGVLDVAEKFRKSYENEDFLPNTKVVEVTVHFWAPLTECLVLKRRELFGQAVGQT